MNDTVNEINTACINDAVEIVSRLKPIYTLKHARRQQEDLFLYGRGLPVLSAPGGARFLRVKVVCSASCYQLASESLVKVIASEPCSEPPMLLGDRLC